MREKNKNNDVFKKYTRLPYIGVGIIGLFSFLPVVSYLVLMIGAWARGEQDMLGMIIFIYTPIVLATTTVFIAVGAISFWSIFFSFKRRKIERLIMQLIIGFILIFTVYYLRDYIDYFLSLILTMVSPSGMKWIKLAQKIFFAGPILIILGGIYDYYFEVD